MSQFGRSIPGSGPGSVVETLTGNTGGAVGPTGGNINVIGAGGITVTGNPGTSTLTITGAGAGFTWNDVTIPAQAMAVNNGYVADDVAGVILTLPAVAAFGSVIRVASGTGLWIIAQNAGQVINFGNMPTTVGVAGSLAASAQYDAVELLCIAANTVFVVLSGQGNLVVI